MKNFAQWIHSKAVACKPIGIIPLPLYLLLTACLFILLWTHQLPHDICSMIAVLVIGGFTCSEIGRSVPLFKHIGGSVILATFVPSYLVAHHYLPFELVAPIQAFWKNDHPLYLFIAAVLVGSVLSMDRLTLIQGFAKIFVPLVCGSIVAAFTGMLVGWMFGLDVFHTFFFVIVPIMAGGFGEGAIPLSIGYAKILEQPQGDVLAQILPVIMFANLCAITLSAVLHLLGRRFKHYSGDGRLQKNQNEGEHIEKNETPCLDSRQFLINIAVAGVTAITFYLIGVVATNYLHGRRLSLCW